MFYAVHCSENNRSVDHPPGNQPPHPAERNLGCIKGSAVQRGRPGQGLLGWVPLGTASLGQLWGAPGSEVCSCCVCEEAELWPHQLPGCPQALWVLHPWQGLQETQGLDLSPRRCHEPEHPWGTRPGQHVAVSLCCCRRSRPGEAGGLQAPDRVQREGISRGGFPLACLPLCPEKTARKQQHGSSAVQTAPALSTNGYLA